MLQMCGKLRYLLSIVLATLLFGAASNALAFEKKPFTLAEFERLKADGEVVLIDVYATWCGTCKKQQKAIQAYFDKFPDRDLHVLVVDFDKQKDIVSLLGAPRQSTLLLFKGDKQFWFSVAETRADVIAARVEQAFGFKTKKSAS